MLEYLRQRSQSAIIIFFVAIICAVFIINFGPQSQGCGSQGTVWLARVYGKTLTVSDYFWVERLVRNRYRLPREYVDGGRYARDVLDGLIEREILAHQARAAGLAVGEESIRDAVVKRGEIYFSWPVNSFIPIRGPLRNQFRDEDGNYDEENFRGYVIHGLQLSDRAFAEQQEADILAERLRQLVEHSVQLSENEVWDDYARYADRVNLKYVRVYPALFRDALRPTKAQLDAWAEEHSKAISKQYEADRFRYRNVRKQVRVLDITVNLSEDAGEDETEAIRARAEAIQKLASAPDADFGLLARCFSDDARGAAKSGDLGYLREGMSRFGSEYDDAVFDLEVGAVSGVIQTKRGLHIVKVLDQREGDIDLDDARTEIAERLYRKERGDARAREVVDAILAKARAGAPFDESLLEGIPELADEECPSLASVEGESDEEAEEQPEGADENPRRRPMMPVIRETGFFNRSGLGVPGIGESSELMAAAFELTEDEPVGERAIQVREDYFIFRLAEDGRREPTREEFEETRAEREQRMLHRKRREALRIYVQRLRRQAEADGEIDLNDEGIRFITRGRGDEQQNDEDDENASERNESGNRSGSSSGEGGESDDEE